MSKEVRYEEAAEHRTNLEGWVCKTCRRFWGKDEHMARWCCATSLACKCGGRNTEKHYTCCQSCRDNLEVERWQKRPRVDWDGETPLVSGDHYFFGEEDLRDYLANEFEWPPTAEQIAALLSDPAELARRAEVLPLARRVLTAEAEVKRLRTALGAIFAGEIAHLRFPGTPRVDFVTGLSPITRAMAEFPELCGPGAEG